MIRVKAYADYGFAGCSMEFEEEFPDNTRDEVIEEAMRELVMGQIDWSWEKITEEKTVRPDREE